MSRTFSIAPGVDTEGLVVGVEHLNDGQPLTAADFPLETNNRALGDVLDEHPWFDGDGAYDPEDAPELETLPSSDADGLLEAEVHFDGFTESDPEVAE